MIWSTVLLLTAPSCILKALLCLQRENVDILDLGTGNGALLVQLARRGYRRLTGADYSAASIDLAAAVLEKHGLLSAVRLVVRGLSQSLALIYTSRLNPGLEPQPPACHLCAGTLSMRPMHMVWSGVWGTEQRMTAPRLH
jgi:SAM-dependent methyltransferase